MVRITNFVKLLCIAMAAVLCVTFVFAVPAFTLDMDYAEQEEAASSSEGTDDTEETEPEESEEGESEDNNTGETEQEEEVGTDPGNSEQSDSEDDPEQGDSDEESLEEDSTEDGNPEEGDSEAFEREEEDETDSEDDGDGEDENEKGPHQEDTVLVSLETKIDDGTIIIVETEIPGVYADSVWLNAEELFPDSENDTAEESIRYYAFRDRTVEELEGDEPDDLRFFDIDIMTDDGEFRPVGTARVKIFYEDKPDEDSIFRAVRFVERNEDAEEFNIDNYDTGVIAVARDEGNDNAITFEDDGLFVYAIAMTNELPTWTLTAEGETYSIRVTYGRDAMIPDDARLGVEEITEETDADTYTEHIKQAAEALYGDPETALAVARLFDITILSNEEEIEPAAPVQVEITIDEPVETNRSGNISLYSTLKKSSGEEKIRVVHFGGQKVEVMDTENTNGKGEEAVRFETDGFSMYAVVKKDEFDASQSGTSLVKKLNGKSFTIVSSTNSSDYGALQAAASKEPAGGEGAGAVSGVDGLAAVPVAIDTALSTYRNTGATVATEWTFEANGAGFNIYTYIKPNDELDTLVKMYLHFTVDETNETRSALSLDEKPQQITVTEGRGELAGRYRISCDGNSLNLDGQDVKKAFYGWEGINNQIDSPDDRKTLFMWLCTLDDEVEQESLDLDNRSFVIVYKGARDGGKEDGRDDNKIGDVDVALQAEPTKNLDNEDRLKAEAVVLDGDKVVDSGEDDRTNANPETWTFKRSGGLNNYIIYSENDSDRTRKYLKVIKEGNGKISISLSDSVPAGDISEGTVFTVNTKGTNRCRISWTDSDTNITYYLNLDYSNAQDGFNFWDASWYDVPWNKGELSFGGDAAPDWLEEDPRFKKKDEYEPGDEAYSTNWTWGTVVNERWTVEELTEEQIEKGWAGQYKVQHADAENEKLYLYLCEPYDGDWPLHGYEYAIIGARPDRSKALLAEEESSEGEGIQLKGSENLLFLPDGKTFLDTNGDIPLWKFEKADAADWYYISTTVSGEKKYLSFGNVINTLSLEDSGVPIHVYHHSNNSEDYVFTIGAGTDSSGTSGTIYLNCQPNGFHNYIRTGDGVPTDNGDFFKLLTPSTQRSYAIVNLLYQDSSNTVAGFDTQTGPKEGAALTNSIQSSGQEISACRVYVWDEIDDDTRADYGTRYVYSSPTNGGAPSQWVFFSAGAENEYYIARIDGSSLKYLSSTEAQFTFNDEIGENNSSFIFTMKPAKLEDGVSDSVMTIENSGGYRLYCVATIDFESTPTINTRAIRAHRDFDPDGIVPSNEQFVLCDLSDGVPEKVTAEKISSQDIKDGDKVVIYYRELTDESTMEFSYFAIDRDGKRREVTDVSDSIKYWSTDSPSIEWTARDDGGNFITFFIYDTMARQYCSILPGGSAQDEISNDIIQRGTVDGTQWEMTAVRLPGWEQGNQGSKIQNWVFPAECFYGIKYDEDAERFIPVEAGDTAEIEFYFARVQEGNGGDSGDEETLETVDTIDSKTLGITIKMYDFQSGNDNRSPDIENVLKIGKENIAHENAKAGILMPVMGDDGYPIAYLADGTTPGASLSDLFSETAHDGDFYYYQGEANHLFLKSIYDKTGYFQYRSENNYAYYNKPSDKDNEVGNFTVYKDVGANDLRQLPTFSHGNFFPYDPLEGTVITDNNYYLFDHESLQLDMSDPRFGDRIHLIENPNYHFGMTMEAKFSQSRDGIAWNGEPLYFSFNGDDDMWVFVDNVLMLDIGGVHGARGGFINFRTGEIWQQDDGRQTGNELRTSIAQRFKDAGIFPDGSKWNDAMVGRWFTNLATDDDDNYTKGTFKNYTEHVLNMYYLERGAGASNLDLTFNLIPLEEGHIYVGKELSAEDDADYQGDYGNVEYTFRAYRMIPNNDGGYDDEVAAYRDYILYDANGNEVAPPDGEDYYKTDVNGVFKLKPGQYADFFWDAITDTAATNHYRVEELFKDDPGQSYKVYINGEETETNAVQIHDGTDYDGWWAVQSGVLELDKQQQLVMFDNRLRTTAALHLLKEVRDTTYPDAVPDNSKTFNFVLFFESEEGKLIPYSRGEYTIDGEAEVHQADANGRIKIQEGQTVVVKGIMPGTRFFVFEEEGDGFAAVEYKRNGEPLEEPDTRTVPIPTEVVYQGENGTSTRVEMIDTPKNGIAGQVGDYLSESGVTSASVIIVNEIKTVNIILTKTDEDGEPLEGATFELRYGDPEKTLTGATVKDTANGARFTVNNLPGNQVYKLVEAKSPDGYILLYGDVEFRPTDSGVIIFTDKGDYFLTKEENEDKVYERDENGKFTQDVTGDFEINDSVISAPNGVKWRIDTDGETTTFDVAVQNVRGKELPSTGGRGTAIFYILGALMAVGAAAALIVRKRITDKR